MSSLQKRILCAMTALCIVVNLAAFASGLWRDSELEKQEISIEVLIAEGR